MHAYGSYDRLPADPDVGIVYVAAPHSEHHRLALSVLAAGKHVLITPDVTPGPGHETETYP